VFDEERAALIETLKQTWSTYGIEVDDLELSQTAMATNSAPSANVLPPLLEPTTSGVAPLLLCEVLGEGGMGVVHRATQTTLDRTVAVKSLRRDMLEPQYSAQLLREGRVTGWLEHPNVVPVHDMGSDAQGRPLIVMKRIDGTPWTSTLDGVAFDERSSPAYLREHLSRLCQVALATHFAHSQGILHRDIKPDNVMIGAFGEVYLVDWGIAVRCSNEGPLGVPLARDVKQIEGTPVYMAPEMALGDGRELGVWSDVYLLGATLHYILTGEGPHDGNNIHEVLTHAFVSPTPCYPRAVPTELALIAQRAMARDPENRYASAAALATALEEYLLHRGSLDLCEEAERRAAELDGLLRTSTPVDDTIEALFHEARFAFEQAIRGWPNNQRARDGLDALLEAMTSFELRRGSPRAALALLRRHEGPPSGLDREVLAAVQRLDRVERDANVALGVEDRVRRAYLGAAGWAAFALLCGALTRSRMLVVDHWRFAALGSVFLVGSFLSYLRWRRTGRMTAVNRRVAYTGMLVFLSSIILWPLMGAVGVSMARATVLGSFVNGLLWATIVFVIGRPWLPMPIGHFAVALLAWFLPAYHFEVFALTAIPVVVTGRWMQGAADPGPP
jgi:serine/threonine-protein kinase